MMTILYWLPLATELSKVCRPIIFIAFKDYPRFKLGEVYTQSFFNNNG